MKIEKLEQRVEILAQKVENGTGGGAPADAYTKAQADAKFETQAHASSTYATKTELGNVDEVPTVGSEDNGKVLKATYSEGTGSYAWETVPAPSGVEMTSNKVTSLSGSSTDTEYPSAKCVYDLIGNVETILATLTTPSV